VAYLFGIDEATGSHYKYGVQITEIKLRVTWHVKIFDNTW